jgi:hypothetical protein
MGKVMAEATKQLSGKADGKEIAGKSEGIVGPYHRMIVKEKGHLLKLILQQEN